MFYLICGTIFLFLIVPIFVIIPISFSSASYLEFPPSGFSLRWYIDFFGGEKWTSATFTSIQVAIVTMALSTILGTLTSLALVRGKFRGKSLIYGIVLSPMVIPIIVIAVAIYYFFSDFHMAGTRLGLILAHTVLATPFVVVNVVASLQGFDITLERAALSLGANRLTTFMKVTFPLIRTGMISGALFAFIVSFDEVVIAIFISGTRNATLPKQMWAGIREAINPTIAAVASLLIVFSILVLLSVEILRRRSIKMKEFTG